MNEGSSILRLSEFLRSPAGQYVLDWEQLQLDSAVVDIFGYHALQLGLPDVDALRENRMPLRFCAANRVPAAVGTGHPKVTVINRYEELPFATHSIDLVVMPHILEFTLDPHQVLREVERVLVPEGHVVITGFNPASLWGVRQYLSRLGASPYLPREGRFLALPRIKDWLKLLSFDVERGRFGCYAPSVRQEKWLARWQFMEKAGDRWWPFLGAIYLLTAVKRVRGMRLIGAVWKGKEEPARRLAPVATTRTFLTGDSNSAVIDAPDAANEVVRIVSRR
ncbi:MAG: methyltransferase domain-containing protein [Pseudomonadota bacterium]|nr:methyltransferase domain-containing protein [Burkholderiaceae bacterium]MDQ3188665.1 methyltransferase domain-containing protein [Pseudomonadota bacterium]